MMQTKSTYPAQQQTTAVSVGKKLNYFNASERRLTFGKWPKEHIMPEVVLAEAGFIFVKEPDMVRCVFCGGYLHEWDEYDVPYTVHKRFYPNCQFIPYKDGDIVSIDITKSPYFEKKTTFSSTAHDAQMRRRASAETDTNISDSFSQKSLANGRKSVHYWTSGPHSTDGDKSFRAFRRKSACGSCEEVLMWPGGPG